ncbi:MAG TPA: thiamine S protein [Verrucomicrobiales bacterium]|nr:thiamine S protein [Verrucomicrobiales bacterium]
MNIKVQFFSYIRDLTGLTEVDRQVPDGWTLGRLHDALCEEYPPLQEMSRSTLLAVGVDYEQRTYLLKDGDVVSFFPPVQGG